MDWGVNYLDESLYLDELSKPYWRRNLRVQYVTQWPVGAPEADPTIGGRKALRKAQFFRGLRDDLRRKLPKYASDWRDGFRSGKSIAAISFLYFACLAPVVAFGGALGGLTQGAMGVSEVLLSCGLCGMGYATFSGQPMTFVAPTGLTLAFTAALYRYCVAPAPRTRPEPCARRGPRLLPTRCHAATPVPGMSLSVPFLPMYSWVGCWTALLMLASAGEIASACAACRALPRGPPAPRPFSSRAPLRASQPSTPPASFGTARVSPKTSSTLSSPSTFSLRRRARLARSSRARRARPMGCSR